MRRRIIFLATAWLLAALTVLAQEAAPASRIDLAGAWKWKSALGSPASLYRTSVDDQTWPELPVPANWHAAGQDLNGSVWFRRHFALPAATHNREVQLVFAGVDYGADVWLNDVYLGFHQGSFEPFSFPIPRRLRRDTDNVLAVLVHCPSEEFGTVWSLHKQLIKGVFGQHDTRPGGAWSPRGQEQNTGGIWAPVYLHLSRRVTIARVHAVPQPSPTGSPTAEGQEWDVPVELSVFAAGLQTRWVHVEMELEPENFSLTESSGGTRSAAVRLASGPNVLKLSVHSTNTQLWSSWERGRPNLYRLHIRILAGGILLDEHEQTIGFRTVSVDPATHEWMLNGKRIFLRGTNYIASQWLSEMTREKYGRDLALMKEASVNAIRVHAHLEAEEFYRLCDQAGLLVWQDFPLQWGYSEAPEFEQEAVRQALAMVQLLGDHPSVVGWTMHNEPPWDASWMQYKYKDYDPQQNKRLDQSLFQAVSLADPTRYTHHHSSTSEHPWLGWYSGLWTDYAKPTTEPFITEFGAQALPDLASLKKIFGPENLWPDTPAKWEEWDFHNFQKHETYDIAHVPAAATLEEFIRTTQQYQATLTQFAAESYRRQRFQPVTAIFQFMWVEDWPSVNWGIFDYWRHPKPGYAALATAYQPVLPSIAYTKDVWKPNEDVAMDLWIVNDTLDDFPGSRLTATLQPPTGVADEKVFPVDVAADSSRKITAISWPHLDTGPYRLTVRLQNSSGETLGHNLFVFRVEE